jgi:TPR repeat protein
MSEVIDKEKLRVEKLISSAEQGNSNAQCELGLMYATGQGVEKDYTQAREWMGKALLEERSEYAQICAGLMYATGQIFETDKKKAFTYFKKSVSHRSSPISHLEFLKDKDMNNKNYGESILFYFKYKDIFQDEATNIDKIISHFNQIPKDHHKLIDLSKKTSCATLKYSQNNFIIVY